MNAMLLYHNSPPTPVPRVSPFVKKTVALDAKEQGPVGVAVAGAATLSALCGIFKRSRYLRLSVQL